MSLPQVKQGLKFDGLIGYLQLPSFTMDTVVIDCFIDNNQPQPTPMLFDARSGLANGFVFINPLGNGTGIQSVSGNVTGQRTVVTAVAISSFTDDISIFSDTQLGIARKVKGEIYSVTCYLNGNIVAQYHLNEGTGTVATDTSGNGNNGTINGATWIIKKAPVKPKKNYFDGVLESGALDITNGSTLVNSAFIRSKNFVQVEPSKQYTFSNARFVLFYDVNKTWISSSSGLNDLASPSTVTTPSNCYYIKFHITGTDTATLVQIEQGAVSTSFEPYQLLTANKPMPQKPKKNMLPPFTDSAWTLHENTRMQVADFSGKISGSTVENPHKSYRGAASTLASPSTFDNVMLIEMSTTSYASLSTLDGSIQASGGQANVLGNIGQEGFSFDVIQHIIRKFGESVFGNARTLAERVAWVKAGNVAKFNCNWSGFGSGPLGNKASLAVWTGASWATVRTTTSSVVVKVSDLETSMSDKIDNNGFTHYLAYADASDGVTVSTINTDKVELEVYLTEAAYAPLRQATSLTLNATATIQISDIIIPALPNTQYIINFTGSAGASVGVSYLDASRSTLAGQGAPGSGWATATSQVFTTPASCVLLNIRMYNPTIATGQFTFDKPQLELGSVATSFENYKLISDVKLVPLVPKKNMIKPFTDSGWVQDTTVTGGSVVVDPIDPYIMALTTSVGSQSRLIQIPVQFGKTYTLSIRSWSPNADYRIYKGSVVTFSGNVNLSADRVLPYSFTVDASFNGYVTLRLINDVLSGTVTFDGLQLEEGSVPTQFAPYQLVHDVKHI